MITRFVFICAAALVCFSGSASAQGQAQKQVVISKAVIKSMTGNKAKSKAPLGAKVGLVRGKGVVATKSAKLPPTSVRAVPIRK